MSKVLCNANLYLGDNRIFLCAYDKEHEGMHGLQINEEVAGKINLFWEKHDPTFDPIECKNCQELVEWNETTICHHDECTTEGCLRCFECQICLSDYCLTHMVLHTLNKKCSDEFESKEGDEIIPLQAKVARAEEGGYYARVVGMTGCITQGENIKEIREMLQDAVNSWLDTDKLFSFKLDFVSDDEFDISD